MSVKKLVKFACTNILRNILQTDTFKSVYGLSVARTRVWHQQLGLDINVTSNNVQVSVILNILEET